MVFKKQLNNKGDYVGIDGKRYDVLSCERTESKQYREIGRKNTEIKPGVFVEEPIMESYIAINYGWDNFTSLEAAIESYELVLDPLPKEEKIK